MAGRRLIFAGGRLDINETQVRILLSGPSGETSADIRRRATAVSKRAKRKAPMRTGELRGSIHVNTRYPSEGAVADITADAGHAIVIEFGRGQIKTSGSRFMVFESSNFGKTIFTQDVAAVGGVHYMRDALDAVDE